MQAKPVRTMWRAISTTLAGLSLFAELLRSWSSRPGGPVSRPILDRTFANRSPRRRRRSGSIGPVPAVDLSLGGARRRASPLASADPSRSRPVSPPLRGGSLTGPGAYLSAARVRRAPRQIAEAGCGLFTDHPDPVVADPPPPAERSRPRAGPHPPGPRGAPTRLRLVPNLAETRGLNLESSLGSAPSMGPCEVPRGGAALTFGHCGRGDGGVHEQERPGDD